MSEKFSMKTFLCEHRRDLVLILSLVFIALISLIILLLLRESGSFVEVTLDGDLVATYSLSSDGEYSIGEGNILVIEDGEAYMKYADCPDHTCVRTGRVSKSGQTIVCLPNRVAVTVVAPNGGADLES